jgi:hypothetical protein
MTFDQAEAILLAERVLQAVGCDGPDTRPSGAWYAYTHEAASVVFGSQYGKELCDGLHILVE